MFTVRRRAAESPHAGDEAEDGEDRDEQHQQEAGGVLVVWQ